MQDILFALFMLGLTAVFVHVYVGGSFAVLYVVIIDVLAAPVWLLLFLSGERPAKLTAEVISAPDGEFGYSAYASRP